MNFFRKRQYRKMVQHLLHEARHARNMREDITSGDLLNQLDAAARDLKAAWKKGDESQINACAEQLSARASEVYPTASYPKVRENLEVLVVALAVAMAFRTFFIQPFKIPTGSMQPTLYGITAQPQNGPGAIDRFPINLISLALFGEKYVEVKASVSGQVDPRYGMDDESYIFYIGGVPHTINKKLTFFFTPGEYVVKGQVLATGRIQIGDHIFVDKVRYNFAKPKRGDIFVFSTDGIYYPSVETNMIRPNTFYIKRLAALPGEEVAVHPPFLVINGVPITEPYPFERLLNERDKGYCGYTLPSLAPGQSAFIMDASDKKRLADDEYLPLGDNTLQSLDGRYFGPVKRERIVGPAFMVYWPLTKRWGKTQ